VNIPHMKARREELGLRQADVAAALGVDRTTVANWETGRAYPDARHLRPLAEVLETTTDALLAEPEPQEVAT
jgi:transcriptional regulator with XRE-family HTH domain